MKKFAKVLTSATLAMTMTAGAGLIGSTVAYAAEDTQDLNAITIDGESMSNGYLKVRVRNSDAHYVLGTTGGNPESDRDNDAKLIYGFPSGSGTSKTTIVVDGNVKHFGDNGSFAETPSFSEIAKSGTAKVYYDNVSVTQVLTFVRNVSTNRDDVMEIKYIVSNEDSVAHDIGVRIMIDTMLGSNDSAPFRVAGVGAVTTETEFEGEYIPQYWQAFDDLNNPTVISQGSFLRDGDATNNPDKVQFCNWNGVKNTLWDYQVTDGRSNGDSAVTVTWYEKPLSSGESRVYTTYYGLSELTQNTEPPLSLSVYGDSIITAKGVDQTTGNPIYNDITVTAYVENIGDEATHNTYAKLVLPRKMSVIGGTNVVSIGTLDAGASKQVTWKVKTAGDISVGDYKLKIQSGCDETTEKEVERKVTIPAILKNLSKVSKTGLTIGESFKITAAAEGGYGTYLYAIYYKKADANAWTRLQDYGTVTTATVKPEELGAYQVMVKVKDGNGSIADKIIDVNVYKKLSNTSKVESKVVNLGNSIVMKGSATGGSGSFQYEYYYKQADASKWIKHKEFSKATTDSFKPTKVKEYDVRVIVKDTKTGKKATKDMKVTVKDPLVNTSELSSLTVVQGNSVKVNASAKGGKAPYRFAVYYKKAADTKWTTLQKLGTTATAVFKPEEAGTYDVCVHAKDAEDSLEKKFFTVEVKEPLKNTSKVSATTVVAGDPITIKASAKGGAGDYKYSVYYKKSGASKWSTKQKDSTNATVTFKPGTATKYTVSVKVTDKDGNVDKKYFTIKATAKLKNTSTITPSAITLGKSVTVNASATGGKGEYQFAVFYKKKTDKKWTCAQSYKTNTSVSITPKVATDYEICVKAKDARGTVEEKKYFDLKVEKGLTNTSTITIGNNKVVLNGSATGSVGTCQYAFSYKKSSDSKWTNKQSFEANSKVSVSVKTGVSYDFCIKVKDVDGNIKKAYYTVKIGQ